MNEVKRRLTFKGSSSSTFNINPDVSLLENTLQPLTGSFHGVQSSPSQINNINNNLTNLADNNNILNNSKNNKNSLITSYASFTVMSMLQQLQQIRQLQSEFQDIPEVNFDSFESAILDNVQKQRSLLASQQLPMSQEIPSNFAIDIEKNKEIVETDKMGVIDSSSFYLSSSSPVEAKRRLCAIGYSIDNKSSSLRPQLTVHPPTSTIQGLLIEERNNHQERERLRQKMMEQRRLQKKIHLRQMETHLQAQLQQQIQFLKVFLLQQQQQDKEQSMKPMYNYFPNKRPSTVPPIPLQQSQKPPLSESEILQHQFLTLISRQSSLNSTLDLSELNPDFGVNKPSLSSPSYPEPSVAGAILTGEEKRILPPALSIVINATKEDVLPYSRYVGAVAEVKGNTVNFPTKNGYTSNTQLTGTFGSLGETLNTSSITNADNQYSPRIDWYQDKRYYPIDVTQHPLKQESQVTALYDSLLNRKKNWKNMQPYVLVQSKNTGNTLLKSNLHQNEGQNSSSNDEECTERGDFGSNLRNKLLENIPKSAISEVAKSRIVGDNAEKGDRRKAKAKVSILTSKFNNQIGLRRIPPENIENYTEIDKIFAKHSTEVISQAPFTPLPALSITGKELDKNKKPPPFDESITKMPIEEEFISLEGSGSGKSKSKEKRKKKVSKAPISNLAAVHRALAPFVDNEGFIVLNYIVTFISGILPPNMQQNATVEYIRPFVKRIFEESNPNYRKINMNMTQGDGELAVSIANLNSNNLDSTFNNNNLNVIDTFYSPSSTARKAQREVSLSATGKLFSSNPPGQSFHSRSGSVLYKRKNSNTPGLSFSSPKEDMDGVSYNPLSCQNEPQDLPSSVSLARTISQKKDLSFFVSNKVSYEAVFAAFKELFKPPSPLDPSLTYSQQNDESSLSGCALSARVCFRLVDEDKSGYVVRKKVLARRMVSTHPSFSPGFTSEGEFNKAWFNFNKLQNDTLTVNLEREGEENFLKMTEILDDKYAQGDYNYVVAKGLIRALDILNFIEEVKFDEQVRKKSKLLYLRNKKNNISNIPKHRQTHMSLDEFTFTMCVDPFVVLSFLPYVVKTSLNGERESVKKEEVLHFGKSLVTDYALYKNLYRTTNAAENLVAKFNFSFPSNNNPLFLNINNIGKPRDLAFVDSTAKKDNIQDYVNFLSNMNIK